MSNNLPPGVTESMLPGNRPEDEEVEVALVFTKGEIDDLKRFYYKEFVKERAARHYLYTTVVNIIEQFNEDGL